MKEVSASTDKTSPGINILETMNEAKRYNLFLQREIAHYQFTGKKTLDFGAGLGTIPIGLRDLGMAILCLEPDPKLRQRLESLGFETISELNQIPDKSFNYIYSTNVLEHVRDDQSILKQLYAKLKPGGILFLYVPAFNVLYSSMDKTIGHVRRYRKSTLILLLQVSGFRIQKAKYVDVLGFFAALLFRFLGNTEGKLDPVKLKLYDRLIFPFSRVLDHCIFGLFGKNILLIAKKPLSPEGQNNEVS